jgi:putative endonuclease
MCFVYVLWSNKLEKRYFGSTDNVPKRFKEHNHGYSKFTKGGFPWNLIHEEEFSSKYEALKREKFLKTGQGRSWLDKIFPQFRKGAGVVFSRRLIRQRRKLAL